MDKKRTTGFDNLIYAADQLIEELNESFVTGLAKKEDAEKFEKEIAAAEIDAVHSGYLMNLPGLAEITVSDDEMSAFMTLSPPQEVGEPVSMDEITDLLAAREIVSGLDWETVAESLFACNTERTQLCDILIARGEEPVPETPRHLVLTDLRNEKENGEPSENTQLDFREICPFTVVEEGAVLATTAPKRPGVVGTNIYGHEIPFPRKPIPQLVPGDNTRTEGTDVVATIHGRFMYQDNTFWVDPFLEIKSNVDYKTGNIHFPGDVLIHGEVRDRFTIACGGNLHCRTTLDAWDVQVAKDMELIQGIIGRKEGRVRCGGTITAKFIENCYIEAKGEIAVKTGILNSSVNTLDKVVMGKRGIIIGGKIFAQNGVEAAQIGSGAGARTEIHCGTDYSVQQKLIWIKESNIKLARKLHELEMEGGRDRSRADELLPVQKKIRAKIHALSEAAIAIINKLEKNSEAEVMVSSTIYPGVQIEICHIAFVVTRPLGRGRFFLDKAAGKVRYASR